MNFLLNFCFRLVDFTFFPFHFVSSICVVVDESLLYCVQVNFEQIESTKTQKTPNTDMASKRKKKQQVSYFDFNFNYSCISNNCEIHIKYIHEIFFVHQIDVVDDIGATMDEIQQNQNLYFFDIIPNRIPLLKKNDNQ